MRFAQRKASFGFLSLLLASMALIMGSQPVDAQSQMRFFQMGLWTDPAPNVDSDIATFWAPDQVAPAPGTEAQPPAPYRTILLSHIASRSLYQESYDWSRIVAVEFDEPYNNTSVDNDLRYPDRSFACLAPALGQDMAPVDAMLQARAKELKALAPKARFWVNFTDNEAEWIVQCANPGAFNRDYIDVISADWSADGGNNNIAATQRFLSVVATYPLPSRPDQQFALIPGVYSAPVDQLPHLQDFFDYANETNQAHGCNLPLGSRGVTGFFDGCPVWIVLGWLSNSFTQGNTHYVGMLDPASAASASIKQAWEAERALPLAPALANQRTPAQIMPPILQSLLLN